jgi:hypothetical protein
MVARVFTIIVFIFSLLSCTLEAEPTDREIIGLWKTVSGETKEGARVDSSSAAEMEFRPGGELVFTLVDPPNGITSPVQMHGTYEVTDQGILTYTMDGKAYERQRFTLKGISLYMEHLDYGTKSELVRIDRSSFAEKPRIVKWPDAGS